MSLTQKELSLMGNLYAKYETIGIIHHNGREFEQAIRKYYAFRARGYSLSSNAFSDHAQDAIEKLSKLMRVGNEEERYEVLLEGFDNTHMKRFFVWEALSEGLYAARVEGTAYAPEDLQKENMALADALESELSISGVHFTIELPYSGNRYVVKLREKFRYFKDSSLEELARNSVSDEFEPSTFEFNHKDRVYSIIWHFSGSSTSTGSFPTLMCCGTTVGGIVPKNFAGPSLQGFLTFADLREDQFISGKDEIRALDETLDWLYLGAPCH